MDFTLTTYNRLLTTLLRQGFSFQTFAGYIEKPRQRTVILRHDVDRLPQNALQMAQLEHGLGISASYYFRILPASWNDGVMRGIEAMGHEIGYHYENIDTVRKKGGRPPGIGETERKGLIVLAYDDFCRNLERFRQKIEVRTICMHGSPMSRYDNRLIWQKYDYREVGIIGEPYFDVDFDKVFYLTDTGRRWDGWQASVRDKMPQQAEWIRQGLVFHTTEDIIRAAEQGRLPEQIMFTVHPQRWHDRLWPWICELVLQNVKNIVKRKFPTETVE